MRQSQLFFVLGLLRDTIILQQTVKQAAAGSYSNDMLPPALLEVLLNSGYILLIAPF